MNIRFLYKHVILFCIFTFCILHFASAQFNDAARYEIDAKRYGISESDNDLLPRSREFIRLDSTYYVGWQLEGTYKFNRSSDYLGYKQAALPLRKALVLFEKDYGVNLKRLYNSYSDYLQEEARYLDFVAICKILKTCYENIERPDSAIWVLDRVQSYNFIRPYLLNPNTDKSWIYHRNRYFTSSKFSFLKNSIAENELAAKQYCYNALSDLEKNAYVNQQLFGNIPSDYDKSESWFRLAIFHDYTKQYDSAEYYYQILQNIGYISYNNYGLHKMGIGEFAKAYEFISRDMSLYNTQMLEEPYYFMPMLNVFAGNTKTAIAQSNEIIKTAGSVPGFGWYNIGLARGYLYDGQLDSCEMILNKAQGFKEIHIGTTLTQEQYDLTINLLRFQLIERKIAQIKFLNPGYWYSFSHLSAIANLEGQRYLLQYVLINQMMANPERDRIMYDLFCSESTITFDETYYLLKDFSAAFFYKKYNEYPQQDKRTLLYKYFNLFAAKFNLLLGNEDEAIEKLESLFNSPTTDINIEKLFMARVVETLAQAYDESGDDTKRDEYLNYLYEVYPQMIPAGSLKINIKLSVSGTDDGVTQNVIDEMKECNVSFKDNKGGPSAMISFAQKSDRYEATLYVRSASGKSIVSGEKLIFRKDDKHVGHELALRLFGKGGARVWQTPVEENPQPSNS